MEQPQSSVSFTHPLSRVSLNLRAHTLSRLITDGMIIHSYLASRLLHDSLNSIHAHLQHFHLGSVTDAHEVMARRVEQITSLGRVEIEENTRHDDGLLLQQGVEERKTVRDVETTIRWKRRVKGGQIEPDIKGTIWNVLVTSVEANFVQARKAVVTLDLEVGLQGFHLFLHFGRLEHGDCGFLEGDVGTAIQVGATGAEGVDEVLWSHDPSNSPAWKSEALGHAVNEQDVVVVDVYNIGGCGDSGPVTIMVVVVARIELVEDESRAVTADVLNTRQLFNGQGMTSWVSRVGGQDDGGATSKFLGDLVGMDVVAILTRQWTWNSNELDDGVSQ